MDYRYCKRCNKLYVFGNMQLCNNCLQEIDKSVSVIRKYLEENPGSNICVLSQNTGVPEKDILYLLREGRLVFSDLQITLYCERCGKPISEGKYCGECKRDLENLLSKTSQSMLEGKMKKEEKSKGDLIKGINMNVLERREKD
ncbi:MAG: MerR family transcriptional regulator [Clostridia bacterium]|nr:MerR family transcriptional regulator [Clostridia bacterium]